MPDRIANEEHPHGYSSLRRYHTRTSGELDVYWTGYTAFPWFTSTSAMSDVRSAGPQDPAPTIVCEPLTRTDPLACRLALADARMLAWLSASTLNVRPALTR